MGFIHVVSKVGAPDKSRVKEVKFLVDTGSWYMVLQPDLAKELDIKPVGKAKLTGSPYTLRLPFWIVRKPLNDPLFHFN